MATQTTAFTDGDRKTDTEPSNKARALQLVNTFAGVVQSNDGDTAVKYSSKTTKTSNTEGSQSFVPVKSNNARPRQSFIFDLHSGDVPCSTRPSTTAPTAGHRKPFFNGVHGWSTRQISSEHLVTTDSREIKTFDTQVGEDSPQTSNHWNQSDYNIWQATSHNERMNSHYTPLTKDDLSHLSSIDNYNWIPQIKPATAGSPLIKQVTDLHCSHDDSEQEIDVVGERDNINNNQVTEDRTNKRIEDKEYHPQDGQLPGNRCLSPTPESVMNSLSSNYIDFFPRDDNNLGSWSPLPLHSKLLASLNVTQD